MARPRSPTPAPLRAPAGGVRAGGCGGDEAAPAGRAGRKACTRTAKRRFYEKKRRKRLAARRRRISARAKPPVRDRAWAAGHFEGEGTVTLLSGGNNIVSRTLVCLSSTDRDVVDFFQSTWPGHVYSYTPNYNRGRACRVHRWSLEAHDAIECFLLDMRPHLKTPRVRRKVALLLHDIRERVQLRRTPEARTRKLARMALMRELNRRGVPPGGAVG